jgi:hypothetical protein
MSECLQAEAGDAQWQAMQFLKKTGARIPIVLSVLAAAAASSISIRIFPTAPARTPYYLPRQCACVLPFVNDYVAIDDHVGHTGGVLMRVIEGRMVLYVGRIKYHDICEIRFPEFTTVAYFQIGGG